MTKRIKAELKPLNNVIQICPVCNKVDVYKGDNHSCEVHMQKEELDDEYE